MVKKKKTLEELLEEALVPEEEQPYKIPKNWVWASFDSVIKTTSNRASPIKQKNYEEKGTIPVIDQGINLISGFTNNQENEYTGELPVIVFGDHTRCIKWVDFNFAQGADGTKLLKPLEQLYSKYFYYVLKAFNIPNKGYSRHFKYLKESVLPMPPLNEQKRIADKVERLISKIDEAKQMIEEALKIVNIRRHLILRDALIGDLTKQWRENNEQILTQGRGGTNDTPTEGMVPSTEMLELPTGWKWIKIEDLLSNSKRSMTTGPFGTLLKKSDYTSSGIPVLGIENIGEGKFVNKNKLFVSEEKASQLSSYSLNKDDIIISRSGTVGELCIVPSSALPAIISTNIIRISLNHQIMAPGYFVYMFLGDGVVREQVRDLCKGSTREFLNQTILKSIMFPVAPIDEQYAIVQRIEKKFIECDNLEAKIMEGSKLIESMNQAILSKAIKGEIGTNDPSEENAIELLKEILQDQVK